MITAVEKVYIAKLAVVTSAPNGWMMHWLSDPARRAFGATILAVTALLEAGVIQAVLQSENQTPRSRASCSEALARKTPLK